MSDGKVLHEDKAGASAFEILLDVKNRYDSVSKKLMVYDRLIDGVKTTNERLDDFLQSFAKFKELLSNDNVGFSNSLSSLKNHQQAQQKMLEEHGINLCKVNDVFSEIKRQMQADAAASEHSICSVLEKYNGLISSYVSISDLDSYKKCVSNSVELIQDSLSSLMKKMRELEAKLMSLVERVDAHSSLHEGHVDQLVQASEPIHKKLHELEIKLRSQEVGFDVKLRTELEKVSQKIDKSKEEILGSPSSIEVTKAELLKKMQSVQLDASNAHLKASTGDQRLNLLERKLENIQILMKQYQLMQ